MNLTRTAYYNGQPMHEGMRITHHSNLTERPFRFMAICEDTNPKTWRGEAWMGSVPLLGTSGHNTPHAAGNEAEKLLAQRLAALLTTEHAPG